MVQSTTSSAPRTVGTTNELRRLRALRYAAFLYAASFLVHNADHWRRGLDVLTPYVFWAGVVSGGAAVGAILLALAGHRLAPAIAVAVGFPMALGVAAVHLAPPWSAFSDAFPGGGVDAVSWLAVLLEIGSAVAFAAAGAYVLQRRRWNSA